MSRRSGRGDIKSKREQTSEGIGADERGGSA